jgi:hypothetical protein
MVSGWLVGFVLLGVPLFGLTRHLLVVGLGLGSDFVVRRGRNGQVVVRGRIPKSKVLEIKEFCSRDLAGIGAFAVRGTWGPGRTLALRWSGLPAVGPRQRVRNFLVELLR